MYERDGTEDEKEPEFYPCNYELGLIKITLNNKWIHRLIVLKNLKNQ